jgi:hypothetical protein
MNNELMNKLNMLLGELKDVDEVLNKVETYKKKKAMIKRTIKKLMVENLEDNFKNGDYEVIITRTMKEKLTQDKVLEIIELFDTNQLDSLSLEDFMVIKESISMKINPIEKVEEDDDVQILFDIVMNVNDEVQLPKIEEE